MRIQVCNIESIKVQDKRKSIFVEWRNERPAKKFLWFTTQEYRKAGFYDTINDYEPYDPKDFLIEYYEEGNPIVYNKPRVIIQLVSGNIEYKEFDTLEEAKDFRVFVIQTSYDWIEI